MQKIILENIFWRWWLMQFSERTMENVIKQWNENLITTEAKNNTWYHTSKKFLMIFYQQKSKEHRCPRIYQSILVHQH